MSSAPQLLLALPFGRDVKGACAATPPFAP
jgi:hypothetical protein